MYSGGRWLRLLPACRFLLYRQTRMRYCTVRFLQPCRGGLFCPSGVSMFYLISAELIGNSGKGDTRMYDVIVVGAGPAGCTAAKVLGDKGYKVLLLEKFRMPRYKSCSGVLIKKSMELVKNYFGEDVPESAMCAPTENRGMIFTDDVGKEYRFGQEGLNVWRSHFDGWLAKKARESGAEVRDGVAALSCAEKDGFVQVSLQGENQAAESARYVLNCEGVVGALKRQIAR